MTTAAEFLTPAASIPPLLPRRLDLSELTEIRRIWGVSVASLILRCRESGGISNATASRGYQSLGALDASRASPPSR